MDVVPLILGILALVVGFLGLPTSRELFEKLKRTGALNRIPSAERKKYGSWAGLVLIAAGLVFIGAAFT